MKQVLELRQFANTKPLQAYKWTTNLNPRTVWYPTLDESNRMKSVYFTIHPGAKPSSSKWLLVEIHFFYKKRQFHILHFPNSTGLFTKPIGHHYTKYRFFLDIGLGPTQFSSINLNLAQLHQLFWDPTLSYVKWWGSILGPNSLEGKV